MKRQEAIETVLRILNHELVIHCNGMVSREAFHALDRPENFYMIGSMGLTASIGLGVALVRPDRKVVIFDGDGNVLMNLGTLTEVGAFKPQNFFHICFDNGVYGSTGNQPTLAQSINLDKVAKSAGYRIVKRVNDRIELEKAARDLLQQQGPIFLLVKVVPEVEYETAGRVTLSPEEIRDRFMKAVETETVS
ncbi:MAG: thiamine pyrophosphate-dependent enzyme [Nitrospira sp.]|nr:thiamine pyrophosphate-dependent enzyme [Nitrospira sp.]